MSYRMRCAEIWGGIDDTDEEIETAALKASIYVRSAEGGKGGDIYYFSACGGDQLTRIAVADVMGHGKEVSDVSGWVYEGLKDHINDMGASEIVSSLNNMVERRGLEAMTTIVVASMIVKQGQLYFTYAGHPPMMVFQEETGLWSPAVSFQEEKGQNLPLGVLENASYDQTEMRLDQGDKLFIYTDGLLEAPAPDGTEFGKQRLLETLTENKNLGPGDLKEAVLTRLMEHTSGKTDHDDVTLLAVQAS
jgi:sigma-B regulation protein RsbU (phosphoserine phosphatase)